MFIISCGQLLSCSACSINLSPHTSEEWGSGCSWLIWSCSGLPGGSCHLCWLHQWPPQGPPDSCVTGLPCYLEWSVREKKTEIVFMICYFVCKMFWEQVLSRVTGEGCLLHSPQYLQITMLLEARHTHDSAKVNMPLKVYYLFIFDKDRTGSLKFSLYSEIQYEHYWTGYYCSYNCHVIYLRSGIH